MQSSERQNDSDWLLPIRVLNNNIIPHFENARPEDLDIMEDLVHRGIVRPEIGMISDCRPVESPCINDGLMVLQETYLGHLWALSYSLFTIAEHVNAKMIAKEWDGILVPCRDRPEAFALFDYSMGLVKEFQKWDLRLPNPEVVDQTDREYIGKVNNIYLWATTFDLAHEFAHAYFGHYEKQECILADDSLSEAEKQAKLKNFEIDADNY